MEAMSTSPEVHDPARTATHSSRRKSSEQTVSPALLQAAAQMSARDSSESPHGDGQDQDLEPDQDNEDDNEAGTTTKRPKRSRACQACRAMKIRCLPVEGQEACKACGKVNRQCIMPGPARKRQKTVHKVAELEKKIDALTASLARKNSAAAMAMAAPTPPTESPANTTSTPNSTSRIQPPATRRDKEYPWEKIVERSYPSLDSAAAKYKQPEYETESVDDDYEDIVARGIISETTAVRIYEYWRDNMLPYNPIVAFDKSTTIDWLRKNRPVTMLTIWTIASGIVLPDLQPDLAVEVGRQLADRVMFYNEKSLDLIQAMLIHSSWHGKHRFARDLAFNHYIHSAVCMCLDLGLGKRSRQQTYSDPEDAEVRRTWLACYLSAGSVATVLRLPPLVTSSPYVEECLEKLVNHPGGQPSDGYLCSLVKKTQLAQDVGLLFHMDDPGSTIPLNDTRTQYHLKLFQRQLEELSASIKTDLPAPVLAQAHAVMSLYIHEIALHNEHNVDDFRPMYRNTGRETTQITKDFLTNAHFESLTACVDAMQRAMQAFSEMDKDIIRHCPAISIVWIAYVAVAMIRLHGVLNVPDSKYGSIFLPKLNVADSLDMCVRKLNEAVEGGVHVAPETLVVAFKKLKAWHVHRTMQQEALINGQQNTALMNNGENTENKPRISSLTSDCGNAGNPTDNSEETIRHVGTGIFPNLQVQSQQQQNFYSLPQQQQQQKASHFRIGQPFQPPTADQLQQPLPLGTNSALLDPNTAIDASTFDIQNWDFTVGELNNFENYLNDAGWMAYLM